MKVTVDRKALSDELALAASIMQARSLIPILSHVLLSAQDGHLTISATDLDLSLRLEIDADVESPGGALLPAKRLLEMVTLGAGDSVTITTAENKRFKVSSGRASWLLPSQDADDFPTLPEAPKDGTGVDVPCGWFRAAIRRTAPCIGEKSNRFQLEGAYFGALPNGTPGLATAGSPRCAVDGGIPESGVIIARGALAALPEFMRGDPVEFFSGDKHHFFRVAGRILAVRAVEGEFPANILREKTAITDGVTLTAKRKPLCDAIRRMMVVRGSLEPNALLTAEDGVLRVEEKNRDLGDASDELPCENSEPIVMLAAAKPFLDQLMAHDAEDVTMLIAPLAAHDGTIINHGYALTMEGGSTLMMMMKSPE